MESNGKCYCFKRYINYNFCATLYYILIEIEAMLTISIQLYFLIFILAIEHMFEITKMNMYC